MTRLVQGSQQTLSSQIFDKDFHWLKTAHATKCNEMQRKAGLNHVFFML
jgi:hypothetical protein